MTIWFTSDTHFGHRRILELGVGRPFDSIEEHDSALASRWAEVVAPEDTIYHLGDVALGSYQAGLGIIKSLPGRKILVPGNHDRIFSGESERRRAAALPVFEAAFDEILEEQTTITLDDGVEYRICHFPVSEPAFGSRKDRYLNLRPADNGQPLIHGHTHQSVTLTKTALGHFQYSVGVDANDWTPVPSERIAEAYEAFREGNG